MYVSADSILKYLSTSLVQEFSNHHKQLDASLKES